jgi:UDP-N-acetylglucosamine acyltransferase
MPTDIHPLAVIEKGAQIGADCTIHSHAIIRRWATLGDRVTVHPFAVVGGDPQDLKFRRGSESWVRIGSGTTIRESVTINRGTDQGGITRVGENCLIMAGAHVAHDCTVDDHAIIVNAVLLAGHVQVGEHAILGGASVYHQFVRVGRGVMVGGGSRISLDLPPYTLAAERNEVVGLNLLGLKRRQVSREAIRELKEAFRLIYGATGSLKDTATGLLGENRFTTGEAQNFLTFFVEKTRGIARLRDGAEDSDNDEISEGVA